MTLENAIEIYYKEASEFINEHGTIAITSDKLGLVDIGNGFTLPVRDATNIIESCLDKVV